MSTKETFLEFASTTGTKGQQLEVIPRIVILPVGSIFLANPKSHNFAFKDEVT